MNDSMTKLSDVQIAAFVDELEKIASETGMSGAELELLKEALFEAARGALSSGMGALSQAMHRQGMQGAGKLVSAFNQPIMTGAAGRGLSEAGRHFTSTAGAGVLGGARHGLGQVLQHKGQQLAGGGIGAVGRAAWNIANPIGTAAETALTSGGHMASRAMGLSPTGMGHQILTKHLPRAGEIGGAAGAAALFGAPVGAAGLIGGKLLGAAGAAAPGMAEAAHHAIGGLGSGAAELAHHVGADVLGTHGHGTVHNIVQKLRGALPGAARAA